MRNAPCKKLGITLTGVLALIGVSAKADTFGSGANAFTIDFVDIGNAGNADDTRRSGFDVSPHYGGVGYNYRMGVTEVPQDWITKATNIGLTNVTTGGRAVNQPATNVTWYEAAAFVNFLNTSTGHQAAYNLNEDATALTTWSSGDAWDNDPGPGVALNLLRNKNAYFFLPSEDEWYKAAYHKNDGVTANYWIYATGSDRAPTPELTGGTTQGSAIYNGGGAGPPRGPADVTLAGGLSPYGTMGQDGNVWEWQEGVFGQYIDLPEARAIRGGAWFAVDFYLQSSLRTSEGPTASYNTVGFRIASVVPEPSSALLLLGSGWMWLLKRRRRPGL